MRAHKVIRYRHLLIVVDFFAKKGVILLAGRFFTGSFSPLGSSIPYFTPDYSNSFRTLKAALNAIDNDMWAE